MIGNGGSFGGPGSGYAPVNKFGANLTIPTGNPIAETIWSHGGQFPFLDTGIPMDFVSTAAADGIAGTGAQKVTVTFYNTDNTLNVVEFDTAGLTPVQVDDDIKICTRIEVTQTGTGDTNAGKITLVDRATGLVVYQSMEIGEGQTLSAVQICPKGKKGLVVKHETTYAKTQTPAGSVDMRVLLRKEGGSTQTKHTASISTANPIDVYEYPIGGIEMSEGDILYCQCVACTANNTPIEARFDVRFEDV